MLSHRVIKEARVKEGVARAAVLVRASAGPSQRSASASSPAATDPVRSRPVPIDATSFNFGPGRDISVLKQALVENRTLAGSEAPGAPLLLIRCKGTLAVSMALKALAKHNYELEEQGANYRLQVSTSVTRPPNFGIYYTLKSGTPEKLGGLLFVRRVSATSLPPITPETLVTKTTGAPDYKWDALSRTLLVSLTRGAKEAPTVVIKSAGTSAMISSWKAITLLRYNAVKGPLARTGQPADGSTAPAPTTIAALDPKKWPRDVAFIPTAAFNVLPPKTTAGSSGNPATVYNFQLLECEAPAKTASAELRLATPAPARSRPAGNKGTGSGQKQRWPRSRSQDRASDRPAREEGKPKEGDDGKVVMSAAEFEELQALLASTKELKEQLNQILKTNAAGAAQTEHV